MRSRNITIVHPRPRSYYLIGHRPNNVLSQMTHFSTLLFLLLLLSASIVLFLSATSRAKTYYTRAS